MAPNEATSKDAQLHIVEPSVSYAEDTPNWVPQSDNIHGSGGGNGGGMDKDYLDKAIEATEARTDVKIGQIHTDLSAIKSELVHKPGLIWAIGLAIAIVAAILSGGAALLQFSNDGFDVGFSTSSAYAKELEANRLATEKRLDEIDAKTEQQINDVKAAILDALTVKDKK